MARKTRHDPWEDETGTVVEPICPLCERPIPADSLQSEHHLIPKLRGGKGGPTVLLHQICHTKIHETIRETDLARNFSTIEALQSHPEIATFIEWVSKRPPGYHSTDPNAKRRKR